jgi:hypothetical protein
LGLVEESLLDSNIHLLINAHNRNSLDNVYALLKDKFDSFVPHLSVIVNDRLVDIKETLEDKRLACNQAYVFSEEIEQRFARELTAKKPGGEYSIPTSVLPAILLTCQIRCDHIEYVIANRILYYLLEQLNPTPPTPNQLHPEF